MWAWQAAGSIRGEMEVDARLLGRPPRVTGEGRVNHISDEPPDGEQHVDPDIIGSVTREDWTMVLESEAPRADLNTNRGFDVHGVTLQTASGHALTSYGHCVLKLQVPPIEGTARVTSEIVDVRFPILSVAMLVASGHRVLFRGQDAVLSTAGGAVRAVDALFVVCGICWCGSTTAESLCWSAAVRHVMCARQLGLIV